jgi:secretory carrier-associated membrane protein
MASDPFADRNALDANPFADPSVQGALHSSGRAYDDLNTPSKASAFDDDDDLERSAGGGLGGQNDSSRLADIERRERELESRERDLQNRADHIKKHGRNNWPFCELV